METMIPFLADERARALRRTADELRVARNRRPRYLRRRVARR